MLRTISEAMCTETKFATPHTNRHACTQIYTEPQQGLWSGASRGARTHRTGCDKPSERPPSATAHMSRQRQNLGTSQYTPTQLPGVRLHYPPPPLLGVRMQAASPARPHNRVHKKFKPQRVPGSTNNTDTHKSARAYKSANGQGYASMGGVLGVTAPPTRGFVPCIAGAEARAPPWVYGLAVGRVQIGV